MIAILTGLLRPFAVPLAAAAGFTAAVVISSVYDRLIDDPFVAHAARKNYVAQVKFDTLKFQLDAERRGRAIAEEAGRKYARTLIAFQREQQERELRIEQEIADYEAKLRENGRQCRLDRGDIDWLRRH